MANIFQIQASATYVQYFPYIESEENRLEWESFFTVNSASFMPSVMQEAALRNAQDVKLGLVESEQQQDQQQVDGGDDGQGRRDLQGGFDFSHIAHGTGFSPYIWSSELDGPSLPDSGPYLPMAQFSPALPLATPLNINGGMEFAFYQGPAKVVIKTGRASLGIMSPFKESNDQNGNIIAMFNASLSQGPYRYTLAEFQLDPVTFIGYPVFDDLYSTTRNVTGVLLSGIYWRALFKDVLPETARGFVVVSPLL
jgi:hypothetical protein